MPISTKRHVRTLLLIELILGFAPVAVLLLVGLFVSAFQVLFLMTSEEVRAHPGGSLTVIFSSLFGLFALGSMVNLVVTLFRANKAVFSRRSTIGLGGIGLVMLAALIAVSETVAWKLFFLVPLLVAVHFIYLGRDELFPSNAGRSSGNAA